MHDETLNTIVEHLLHKDTFKLGVKLFIRELNIPESNVSIGRRETFSLNSYALFDDNMENFSHYTLLIGKIREIRQKLKRMRNFNGFTFAIHLEEYSDIKKICISIDSYMIK